ncbi:MAG: TasA family protein, partial [Filifactoraceae bacterium]
MHKKKIQTLIAAGVLSVGIIGGTLAWFTSQDDITNVFNTGSVTDPTNPDAGIDITENFPGSTKDPVTGDMVYDKPVLPGDTMTKEVSVTSKADYDQFLRAKITKVW